MSIETVRTQAVINEFHRSENQWHYERGRNAYWQDRGDIYLEGNETCKEGYRDAWLADNQKRFENDMSGDLQADAWEAHRREIGK